MVGRDREGKEREGMKQESNPADIDVEILRETNMAIFVSNGDMEAWIPKSQIIDSDENFEIGTSITITIPEWLAIEKELI